MELQHIELERLCVSPANMRHGRRDPDIDDILPSIRARGVLVPLLVRRACSEEPGLSEQFEIVAGRRRYFAARAVAAERGGIDPLPCAVMAPGDDAAALEASLLENLSRLDPDEMTQYETFARLIDEGRSVADIAALFGLTELMVKRRLALGTLLPKIRDAYRRAEIDIETVQHLTMASKAQQKAWLALHNDPAAHAPRGWQCKQWLFGGQHIATSAALFPLDRYDGRVVADLFGERSYFADADRFWQLQNAALAARRDALLAAGWSAVEVLEPGRRFADWEHVRTSRRKGGKVFVTVSPQGEVEIHEGWLTRREANRAVRSKPSAAGSAAAPAAKPARPEATKAMQTYIDLHRHALVRLHVADAPGTALRLMVAHAVGGSGLWSVRPEPQRAGSEETAKSLAGCAAEAAFAVKRREALSRLGCPEHREAVAHVLPDDDTASMFARLLAMSDADVLAVLAVVMAETLEAGSAMVEAAGVHLAVDARGCWRPDDAFFTLLGERTVVNGMLAEVAGKPVADGNIAEPLKTQKRIMRACLDGSDGRPQVEGWVPGWFAFPIRTYSEAGALRAAEAWARVAPLFERAG